MSVPQPKSKMVTYHSIVKKVHHHRLTYFWRLSSILSVAATFVIVLLGRASILSIVPKFALLWLAFAIVKTCRDMTLQIGYSGHKTLASHLLHEFPTKNMLTCLIAYLTSGSLFFTAIYFQMSKINYHIASPTKTVKASISDKFVYFWFFATFYGSLYAVQQLLFEKNRLKYKYGIYRIDPQQAIRQSVQPSAAFAVAFSGVLSVFGPILFLILRSHLYGVWLRPFCWIFGLSSDRVVFDVSLGLIFKLFLASTVLCFSWEMVNKIFDAYASVGCLHKGEPLSSQSEDPAATLLSGLRDNKNPMARMLAFQELAFLATSKEPKHRAMFYTGRLKHSYVWTAVLEECTIILKAHSLRMQKGLKATKPETSANEVLQEATEPLFGNTRRAGQKTNDPEDTSIFDTSGLFPTKEPKDVKSRLISAAQEDNENDDVMRSLKELLEQAQPVIDTLKQTYNTFLTSEIGIPFVSTMAREATSRVKNPSITGNAMIAITYILSHAQVEDKNKVVLATIPEVLELLEQVVHASSVFLDLAPGKVMNTQNIIEDIHDLSLRLFFDLTVKFNAQLSNLILTPHVFKLAKWCIDLAIEQQKTEQEDNSTFFK